MKDTILEVLSAVRCSLNQEKYIEPITNEKAFYIMSMESYFGIRSHMLFIMKFLWAVIDIRLLTPINHYP
ncbi:MAG: hypothetical protein KKH92_02580 [Firmicutes bacterium]|nr:hypothetical protein [Bacillota bacterium]